MNDEYIVTDELAKILERNYDVQRKDIRITNEYRASALTWYLRCLVDFASGRLGISRESFALGYLKDQVKDKKVDSLHRDNISAMLIDREKEFVDLENLAEKTKLDYVLLFKLRTRYCKIWDVKTGNVLGYAIVPFFDDVDNIDFAAIVSFLDKLQDFVINDSSLFDSALSLLADEVNNNLEQSFILTSSENSLYKNPMLGKTQSIIQLNGYVMQNEVEINGRY